MSKSIQASPRIGDKVEIPHEFPASRTHSLTLGPLTISVALTWEAVFRVEEINKFEAIKAGRGWYMKGSYFPARPLWRRLFWRL